jgi:hypothetical protein
VLFPGVLHHLRHPLLALDIVSELTRDALVVQTLTMPETSGCTRRRTCRSTRAMRCCAQAGRRWRRPRLSMWQSHSFDPASLPGGAGIPAFQAPRSWTTHVGAADHLVRVRGAEGTGTGDEAMAATGNRRDPLRAAREHAPPPSRDPSAQRCAMQAALVPALMAMRTRDGRRGGWRPPPGGAV